MTVTKVDHRRVMEIKVVVLPEETEEEKKDKKDREKDKDKEG